MRRISKSEFWVQLGPEAQFFLELFQAFFQPLSCSLTADTFIFFVQSSLILLIILFQDYDWQILFTGLVSAIATLDGKQYNYLRSKLHILVNKVNTRTTISGFKVCLPSPSLTRNTSYPKNLRVIWIGSFSSFFSPWLFPSNCDYMFGLDESGGN